MELDVNSLGELLRKERASSAMQAVSETFYSDLKNLFREVDKKYPPYSRERENLRNLATDLFNTREKKLVLFALSYSRTGENVDVDNLTPEEREFLRTLVEMLGRRREDLLKKKGEKKKEKSMEEGPKPDLKLKEERGKEKTITLRILQELPPIVGSDGKTYGPFKAEDIIALPERNAKSFIRHGYGETIEYDY